MIMLKITKANSPVCDVKNLSGNLTTLGLFFVENKDFYHKSKLDSLLYSGGNNSKAFKKCQVI